MYVRQLLLSFSQPFIFLFLNRACRVGETKNPQLGVVQLNLEFNGVERSFSVSPLHATLIMHFEGKNDVRYCT